MQAALPCPVLRTSNESGASRARNRDVGFEQFTLQDFGDEQVDRFIGLRHTAAFITPANAAGTSRGCEAPIENSPAIRELAASPLLLTMMAVLSRSQDLPRERGRL
jgi:hypothetical protein